jgi:hypothetical protein
MHRLTAAVLLACVARVVPAQAPKITTAGDPSVRADTIYRLAVDPARFPEQDAAFLLDDGVVRAEADGRHTRTFRQIVQVLKPSGAERLQEQTFSYSPRHERLTINWIRVVRANGEVVSAKPSHVQDAEVPADTDDPVYSDRRVKRASLSGVAPGTIVDYSYTVEELKPAMPRDFYVGWGVSTGLQVARSRFVVDVPATMTPRILEENLNFARVEKTAGGRRVYTWATGNLPKIKRETFAADSNGVYMSLAVGASIAWEDVGRWYGNLARTREVASPWVTARVDSVVRAAGTRDDSIRAVHKWVAQDIRYVSIDLGSGGYQPRESEQVVRTGFGDCKDKATLFVVALRHLGIGAYPVLLSSTGHVQRQLPTIKQFDHEIAAVSTGSGYTFTDLTVGVVPYGDLPVAEQGGFALVVHPDGSSEQVTLPRTPLTANRTTIRVVATLDSTGILNGAYEESGEGAAQYGLRNLFYNPLDSAQRANLANAIAGKLFEGAEGDSLVGFDGKDLGAMARTTLLIRRGKAATPAGATMILHMPLASMSSLTAGAKELEAQEKRRFPIDPAQFWGVRTSWTELAISLPTGWHAQLPKSVKASSPFGTYESSYTEEKGVLRLTRRIIGSREVQPPEKIGDFIAWLRAVGSDDAKFIVLSRGTAAGA